MMDVYVRFNGSVESDTAFQIDKGDTIENKLSKIFSENPRVGLSDIAVLRPSIFHEKQPIGYFKSVHPGYLTEAGCLIFHFSADEQKYLVRLDNEKPLVDQLWPGQLIIPEWKISKKNLMIYGFIMACWLYTDLPDCISPTPGICLSNQISRRLIPVMELYGRTDLKQMLIEETTVNYSTVGAQWGYFAMHLVKVLLFTLVFYTGMGNPLSFNPIKLMQTRSISSADNELKDVLKNIGWLGTKRADYNNYQSIFHGYVMKKYGGMVGAMKANMIRAASRPGLELSNGEGFQTPLSERYTGSTLKTMEEKKKFVLSEEYYDILEEKLKYLIKESNGNIGLANYNVRQFRRFGFYEAPDKLKQVVEDRKAIELEPKFKSDASLKEKKKQ